MSELELIGVVLVVAAAVWLALVAAVVAVGLYHVWNMESPDAGCGRRGCGREACRHGCGIETRAAEPLRVISDTNWRE